ncbi:hypothetical protein [Rhodopirellula halodulae]|uniref:hypothetical protein n=1 Tax=Rhodopirellula halodulae TaxID=2894198 RepID=UPI001E29EF41|nr:hypothetical protein [Rhodopirellula sp. JC737]MCC9658546.1 hypothetical protein [Rhodopirellula sp. JC737]
MVSPKSCLAIALLAVAVLLVSTRTSAQNSAEDSGARVRELLVEKRDVLAKYVDHTESQFATGELSSVDVLDAKLALLDAELELAGASEDRVKILRRQFELQKTKESQVAELYAHGNVTFKENMNAVVERIDAEIALSRAMGGE